MGADFWMNPPDRGQCPLCKQTIENHHAALLVHVKCLKPPVVHIGGKKLDEAHMGRREDCRACQIREEEK